MAIYHLSAKVGKRSSGQNAVASASYRSAEKLHAEAENRTFDYSRRDRIEHTAIYAPENAADWMRDREKLWNGVEGSEKRKDAQLYREVELALPHELNTVQRVELVRGFVQENFVSEGMIADVALHQTKNDNPHAHIMLTLRDIDGEGFGNKNRDWNKKELLSEWRESWQTHANDALTDAGSSAQIDHRTLKAQGIDREPSKHIGVNAAALEAKGVTTERGNEGRAVAALNKVYEKFGQWKDSGLEKLGAVMRSAYQSESSDGREPQQVEQKARDWREKISYEREAARTR